MTAVFMACRARNLFSQNVVRTYDGESIIICTSILQQSQACDHQSISTRTPLRFFDLKCVSALIVTASGIWADDVSLL